MIVTSFYKFTEIPVTESLKNELLVKCNALSLKGTILLAKEGVNGSICGTEENIKKFYNFLPNYPFFSSLSYQENYSPSIPFQKMKIKLKDEIIAMGEEEIDGNDNGEYIKPEKWDDFIKQDNVILIDTRNDYEYQIGTFRKAINPDTDNFKEFPKWFDKEKDKFRNKQIAMFCTGGVRCEKSTAYLKKTGFDQVFHLQGGIINYLKQTKNKNKQWLGKCFVFDDRCALNDDLSPAKLHCYNCNIALLEDQVELRRNQKKFYCQDCFEGLCKERIL